MGKKDLMLTEMDCQGLINNFAKLQQYVDESIDWENMANKPFGESISNWEEITPEFSLTTSASGFASALVFDSPKTFISAGKNYKVILNGIEYESIGKIDNGSDAFNGLATYGAQIAIDTADGFPATVGFFTGAGYATYIGICGAEPNTEYKFSIHEGEIEVITLDEKYMPLLTSPDGSTFRLAVDNDGNVSAEQVFSVGE